MKTKEISLKFWIERGAGCGTSLAHESVIVGVEGHNTSVVRLSGSSSPLNKVKYGGLNFHSGFVCSISPAKGDMLRLATSLRKASSVVSGIHVAALPRAFVLPPGFMLGRATESPATPDADLSVYVALQHVLFVFPAVAVHVVHDVLLIGAHGGGC